MIWESEIDEVPFHINVWNDMAILAIDHRYGVIVGTDGEKVTYAEISWHQWGLLFTDFETCYRNLDHWQETNTVVNGTDCQVFLRKQ